MPEKPAKAKEDKESTLQEQEPQEAALGQPEKQEPEQEVVREPAEEKPEAQKKAKKPGKHEPEKPEPAKTGKPRISRDDNVVLVGKKPAMSYVMAVVTQFSMGASGVDIRARGRSISRAVDVAEVARKRFLKDLKYRIEIGTDEITDDQGSRVNVSTININLSK
jgi:DNA-binding protein